MTRLVTCGVMLTTGLALLLMGASQSNSQHSAATPVVTAVVPYNGAVYNGPPGLTPEQGKKLIELLESVDSKLDLLQSIDDKLAAGIPGNGKSGNAKAAPRITWQQVVSAKCASCHRPGNEKGDFMLVGDDGKTARPLSTREWARVVEAVESGHMPPPEKGKLSPAEKAAFGRK